MIYYYQESDFSTRRDGIVYTDYSGFEADESVQARAARGLALGTLQPGGYHALLARENGYFKNCSSLGDYCHFSNLILAME